MRIHKLNEAILHCLEHVAGSTSPPCVGAADFLIRLLDTDVFTCDEMDEITRRVGVIIHGINERHDLAQPRITAPPVIA